MSTLAQATPPLLVAAVGLGTIMAVLPVDAGMVAATSIALALLALATSVAVLGPRGPRALAAAVAGGELAPVEVRTVRACARAVLGAGIATGLVAVLMLMVSLGEAAPARLAGLLVWALNGPAIGLLLGRVWLGGLADRCGETDTASDGFVFAALAVAAAAIFAVAVPV